MTTSSPSSNPKKYDVFISFSGDDVRNAFLSHLFDALTRKGINAFKDENLAKGEDISPALLNVIKESCISIVIFSQKYPYSTWCLDELAQILDCYKTMGHIVLPVFYHVDPSHVEKLQGNFESAFNGHRKRFKDCLEKVDIWSRAVQEISCISGFVSSTVKPEAELIEEIAVYANRKLSELYLADCETDGLFGIDLHVRWVESLLCIQLTNQMRIVGIQGLGGIGKTTIVDKLCNKIKKSFDASYFIENVREALEKRGASTSSLRDEIFRELLGERDLYIGTPQSLEPFIKRRLQSKRVLIVFDDVADSKYLRSLMGEGGLYAPGSRIIITSRDGQVLKNLGAKEYIYLVEGLNHSDALQLLSWHAFRQNHPVEGYMNVSLKLIQYAKGIPLALIVLGSNLFDKTIEEWEDELEKLQSIPDPEITKILRISYDGLQRHEQNIFLDIACFFKFHNTSWVKGILKSFGFFPETGIRCLSDKSLVTRDHFSRLTMHDLLEQMGKDIVVQESNGKLGEQSRLWTSKDIIPVLEDDLGTSKIEGILLNEEMNEVVEISSKAFKHMRNLRFLKISSCYQHNESESSDNVTKTKIRLPDGLEFLPVNLRYLYWDQYPLKYLPSNFSPNNLVELIMPFSELEELKNLDKSLKKLKRIDLRFSKHLIRIPDFSKAFDLGVLELEGCSSLIEISWSTKARSKRLDLDLRGCKLLRHLLEIPHNIQELNLKGTSIQQFPPNIELVQSLQIINLAGCSKLATLPDSICNLKLLVALDVSFCRNLHQLPKNFGNLRNLRRLRAQVSGIQELPETINQLFKLEEMDLQECVDLTLPPLDGLSSLRFINLNNCHMLEFPESICSLKSLKNVYLGGNNFKSITGISRLSNLLMLDLSNCKELIHIPKLPSNLLLLNARSCTSLESISTAVLPNCLILANCLNLKQNVSSTIVERVLERRHSFKYTGFYYLSVIGSEVPERMMHKNNCGSCLSVTLDCHDLLGFSLCAVLASDAHLHPTLYLRNIKCYATFKYFSGFSHIQEVYFYEFPEAASQSQTLFLWYSNFSGVDSVRKASFQFYTVDAEEKEDKALIIKCGFHPIFNDADDVDSDDDDDDTVKFSKNRKRKYPDF